MNKIKTLIFPLLLTILFVWCVQAHPEGFPLKNHPAEGKSLAVFLPKGWTVEDQASGDLNGDGVPDMAVVLVQGGDQSQMEDEPQRALIVLLSHGKENFTLAGINDKFFQCKGCGGIKEGVVISIKKGVIVAEQMSGSREFANETWRFRYDPKARRFVIIGRDLETGDGMRGTGTIESNNYLTGLKITENYRYDKNGEHKIALSTKKEKVPRQTLFMEDVKASY
jgi:hypothetical protein